MGWRDQAVATILAAGFTVACGAVGAGAQQQANPIACGGDAVARGTVNQIIDGRTFRFDDGREVRLAAVEVPLPILPQQPAAAPGGAEARAALDALVGGDDVVLRRAPLASDRYGRLVGYAYALRDGDELFAQGELIASGFARVGDSVGGRPCAAELLHREAGARDAKLGLWADGYYDVLDAEKPSDVLAQRGRFALVEGKVLSVRESGPVLYVNFGQRWSEGFAVTVLKRNERNFAAAGLDLKSLEGRRVRVRGWIEQRGAAGSPGIEAAHPEQIEIAELKRP